MQIKVIFASESFWNSERASAYWIYSAYIFLIVGEEYMDGVNVADGPLQPDQQVSVPVEADFLYVFSTVPGYYSWRNIDKGSWFIQSVVKVFNEHSHHMDILQMLTRVNALVSSYQVGSNKRQASSTVSMLRKDLYFFPENVTESQNNADDTNPSMRPPRWTKCIIFWKWQNPWDIEKQISEGKSTAQDQSCHLDFKLLGICN